MHSNRAKNNPLVHAHTHTHTELDIHLNTRSRETCLPENTHMHTHTPRHRHQIHWDSFKIILPSLSRGTGLLKLTTRSAGSLLAGVPHVLVSGHAQHPVCSQSSRRHRREVGVKVSHLMVVLSSHTSSCKAGS